MPAPRGAQLRVLSAPQGDLDRVGQAVQSLPEASWGPAWQWPLLGSSRSTLTSGFGPRWGRVHEGIDLGAASGTPVVAVATGLVVRAGAWGTLGLAVEVEHLGGWTSRYGHLSRLEVVEGTVLRRGEVLGAVGQTGRATGPHLHLELRHQGVVTDPCAVLGCGDAR